MQGLARPGPNYLFVSMDTEPVDPAWRGLISARFGAPFSHRAAAWALAARMSALLAEYLHVMCHSNEPWPGTSPYCRNRGDPERFYVRLEGLLTMARERGYRAPDPVRIRVPGLRRSGYPGP